MTEETCLVSVDEKVRYLIEQLVKLTQLKGVTLNNKNAVLLLVAALGQLNETADVAPRGACRIKQGQTTYCCQLTPDECRTLYPPPEGEWHPGSCGDLCCPGIDHPIGRNESKQMS